MSTHGDTRRAAFRAACELAAGGERPTVVAVRARLGGKGGQAAIQAGLNDWVEEAARRFQLPALPESLQTAVIAFWDVACHTAQREWDEARDELLRQLKARDEQLASLSAAHEALGRDRDQVAREGEQRAQALELAQAELLAAHQHARVLETERADLEQRRADAEARIVHLEQAHTQLAAQLRALEDDGRRREDALRLAEREREQWQLQARAAEQTVARLEQSLADQADHRARLEERVQESHALQARQQQALDEREARIQTLIASLERAQATYDAESAHWLAQIDDQRQALGAAREREQRLEQARATLWQEVQALTQALRMHLEASAEAVSERREERDQIR